MNKSELIYNFRARLKCQRKEAELYIREIFRLVKDTLRTGEDVSIPSFGKFKVKITPAGLLNSPLTGEVVSFQEERRCQFKQCGAFFLENIDPDIFDGDLWTQQTCPPIIEEAFVEPEMERATKVMKELVMHDKMDDLITIRKRQEKKAMLDPLFTTAQLAEYLGISTKKIGELCAQRKLGYVLIGKKTRRFTEDMVRQYVASQSRIFDENGKLQPTRGYVKQIDGQKAKLGTGSKKSIKEIRKELRALCR